MYLGLLSILFQRPCSCTVARDLRDVAVSCWMTDFRSIRWANDPTHIASRFKQYPPPDESLERRADLPDP